MLSIGATIDDTPVDWTDLEGRIVRITNSAIPGHIGLTAVVAAPLEGACLLTEFVHSDTTGGAVVPVTPSSGDTIVLLAPATVDLGVCRFTGSDPAAADARVLIDGLSCENGTVEAVGLLPVTFYGCQLNSVYLKGQTLSTQACQLSQCYTQTPGTLSTIQACLVAPTGISVDSGTITVCEHTALIGCGVGITVNANAHLVIQNACAFGCAKGILLQMFANALFWAKGSISYWGSDNTHAFALQNTSHAAIKNGASVPTCTAVTDEILFIASGNPKGWSDMPWCEPDYQSSIVFVDHIS
jgi:hypothetical protein